MWRQHLFSKRTASPGGQTLDDFHTLTEKMEGDYSSVEKILRRPGLRDQPSVAFIQDCGDELYIGVDGRIKDALPARHDLAFEKELSHVGAVKGRPITFVQGFFAQKGNADIPSIDELVKEYPKHLEDVLVRANSGEEPVRTGPVRFSTKVRSESGTQWDSIAKEFQRGKHQGKTATFAHDGKLLGWLEQEVGTFTSKVAGERSFPKKTIPLEMPPRIAFLPLAGITLGVMTAGWLVWELVKALTNQGQSRH